MTYRGRAAARAAHKKAVRDAVVQAEVDRRVRNTPPRVEVKLEPIPVMAGKGYGPASAFEVGAKIERRMEYDRKGDRVYVHRLNEPPSQRAIVVAIQPSPRLSFQRGPEGFMNAASHLQRQAEFHVERWRWNMRDDDTTNVVEWFTWKPRSDRKAYPAVRQAKVYLTKALQVTEFLPPMPQLPESATYQFAGWVTDVNRTLREVRDCIEIVRAAAHEWLCDPDEGG